MVHAEDLHRSRHLVAAHVCQIPAGQVNRRIQDVAAFTTGTGDDHDLATCCHIFGQRGGTLLDSSSGCVYGHQPQGLAHRSSCCRP